jgi:hypothetical protein
VPDSKARPSNSADIVLWPSLIQKSLLYTYQFSHRADAQTLERELYLAVFVPRPLQDHAMVEAPAKYASVRNPSLMEAGGAANVNVSVDRIPNLVNARFHAVILPQKTKT